ncbi:MAG: hypothetical protein R3D02_04390 [Hyphomicrobiales bacterium]
MPPTILVGGGRVPTVTTEAIALAAGRSRRVISVYAIDQMVLPFVGFLDLALFLPAVLYRHRSAANESDDVNRMSRIDAKGLVLDRVHIARAGRPLLDLSLAVAPGEVATVMGQAASAKSTLLACHQRLLGAGLLIPAACS